MDARLDYTARPVPIELGERLRSLLGLHAAPATLGEVVAALASALNSTGPGAEALCTAEVSRHEVTLGQKTLHTHCVMDALILPALAGAAGVIRSESPLDGQIVEIQVTSEGVLADPPEAVVSFGMLREGSGTPQEVACPYINAFPSMQDYERWAAATPESVTMALPVALAFELAGAMARGGCAQTGDACRARP